MKNKVQWLCAFAVLGLLLGATGIAIGNIDKLISKTPGGGIAAAAHAAAPVVVIDPGHGGEDGGCSAADGTTEKELNLEMSRCITDILNASGYRTVMTRETDTLLYDMYGDLTDYKGHKKTYDLRNRLRFTKEAGAEYLVSIHMNKFTDSRYSGLQVYYSPNTGESLAMADRIQGYTEKYLQTDNDRLTKKAGSAIYLLNRSEIPAVLVECGFLSNSEEAASLCDPVYRRKLSVCIAAGIIDSIESARAVAQQK